MKTMRYLLMILCLFCSFQALAQLELYNWPGSSDIQSDKYSVRVRTYQNGTPGTWQNMTEIMSKPRDYDTDKVGFPASDFITSGGDLVHKICGGDASTEFLEDRTLTFVEFGFSGTIEVEVTKLFGGAAPRVEVSPKAYGINPHYFDGTKVRFLLTEPRYVSVNFDVADNWDDDRYGGNNIKHGVMIFGDKPESQAGYTIPSQTGANVVVWNNNTDISTILNADIIYFPPGDHKMKNHKDNISTWQTNVTTQQNYPLYHGQLRLTKPGQKVYIAGGAYVRGAFNAKGNDDCWIYGRGIVSGRDHLMHEILNYGGTNANGTWKQSTQIKEAFCHFATGAQYHGVIFKEAFHHTCPSGQNTVIKNIKIIGWCSNNDGIRPGGGSDIDGIFVKTSDDYDYARDPHEVRNSVFWPGVNGAVGMLGWGNLGTGFAEYRDNYIINSEWSSAGKDNTGVFGSVADDGIQLEYNVIERMAVEDKTAYLINVTLENKNGNSFGYIRNFLIKDVKVEQPFQLPNGTPVKQRMAGLSNNWIDGWVFTNLIVDGKLVKWNNYQNYFDLNLTGSNGSNTDAAKWVKNITFNSSGTIHNITVTANAGGSFFPSGNSGVIDCPAGTDQTVTILPSSGKKITDVLIDGVSQGRMQSVSFENVTGNHTVQIVFGTGNDYYDFTPSSGGCSGIQNITDLTAVQNGCGTVDLNWSADPCAIQYIVRRKIVGEATFTNLATVTATSYADNSVALGTSYEYQVRPDDGTTKMVSNYPVVNMPATCGATGLFHIFNKNFGKKIRPYSGGVSQVEAGSTGDWTQWEQVSTSGGYFRLQNQGSLQYLSMPDATDEAMITTSTATTNQEEWKTVDTGDGYFHLENRASGKRIRSTSIDDYSTNPTGDHTVKVAPSSATGDWTRWEFVSVGGARFAAENTELSNKELTFYPNPVSESFKLIWKGNATAQVQILDLQGKVVRALEVSQGTKDISTAQIPAGVYLLKVESSNFKEVNKLVIK
ncbi:T9SS type A sorting domain-containing protein [Limibacter armeniacum]|uniref:T9SS type A sorting domain-containing protein n=1 Tax=Limibacter armeniacum TaxID=466084 RepID=UPI002FE5CA64